MNDERINVTLTAKTQDELKIKIKRYYYSYPERLFETTVKNIYEEEGIFKVLIDRIK
jgi:hypothetical protein